MKKTKLGVALFTILSLSFALTASATVQDVNCGTPLPCTIEGMTIVSDTSTMVTDIDGNPQNTNSVVVTPTTITDQYWTADVGDANAKWIWSEDPVGGWQANKFVTFEKQFNVPGTPLAGAELLIAADNSYEVWLNNVKVSDDVLSSPENNHQLATQDTYPVTLQAGNNVLKVVVKNWAQPNGSQLNNPGGLLYKLALRYEDCPPPPAPDCCAGDVEVKNYNSATVSNVVITSSNTGNNTSVGGFAKTKIKGFKNTGNSSTSGNTGSISTGDATSVSTVSTKVNTNKTKIKVKGGINIPPVPVFQ